MPTLNWIGKEAVVNHHLQVPFHLLKDVPELACGDPGSGNLIGQGDNLVTLKALPPYHASQMRTCASAHGVERPPGKQGRLGDGPEGAASPLACHRLLQRFELEKSQGTRQK
jgi:hypothetical protein